MKLTATQSAAIFELVSISASARDIANRIDPNLAMTADLETLKSQVARMSTMLESISQELDESKNPEAQFTDADAFDFNAAFTKSLEGLTYRVIVNVYGTQYMRAYPRNIRVLVCTALLNHFTAKNLKPLSVWTTVVANNGALS